MRNLIVVGCALGSKLALSVGGHAGSSDGDPNGLAEPTTLRSQATQQIDPAAVMPPVIRLAQAEGGPAPGSPEARYQAAFEAMMADITDPERSFEFAQAAVAVGDVRGAIAALERILLLNPNLPNIALELGVLYQRVGNDVLAAEYLRQALAAEQIPHPVRARAEAMLAAAEAAITRHQFRGSLFAGLRFDTNANAAPELVRLAIVPDPVPPDEPERDDFSILGVATLGYDYLLGTQAGDAIQTNLLLFTQQYRKSDELDAELVDIDIGPRLHLGPVEAPWFAVRPFAEASYLRLGGETYRVRYGGGVGLEKTISPRLFADGALTVVYQDFSDTEDQPNAEDRTGLQIELESGLAYLLRPTTTLSGGFDYIRRNADEDFEALHEVVLTLAAIERYRGPFELVDEPWSVSLSFDVSYARYDEPDPQIDPDERREDTRIDLALTNTLPLTRSITLATTGRYTNNWSTLPNFEYDNLSLTVGVGWRF